MQWAKHGIMRWNQFYQQLVVNVLALVSPSIKTKAWMKKLTFSSFDFSQ